jgi:hypothetical protein
MHVVAATARPLISPLLVLVLVLLLLPPVYAPAVTASPPPAARVSKWVRAGGAGALLGTPRLRDAGHGRRDGTASVPVYS